MRKPECKPTAQKNAQDTDGDIDSIYEPMCQDVGIQACFGINEPESFTLGAAKDRIIILTQMLARKDKLLVETQAECKLFERAFNEAKLQNSKIA